MPIVLDLELERQDIVSDHVSATWWDAIDGRGRRDLTLARWLRRESVEPPPARRLHLTEFRVVPLSAPLGPLPAGPQLTGLAFSAPSVGMLMLTEDFHRDRPRNVGQATHRAIAQIAALTRRPDVELIRQTAKEVLPPLRPDESLAHQQTVAMSLGVFFTHLLPPPTWAFVGHEVVIGSGRVDIVWREATSGQLLIDEVKTGRGGITAQDRRQTARYAQLGWEHLGDELLGVRLVSTKSPYASELHAVDGTAAPLASTGLMVAGRVR